MPYNFDEIIERKNTDCIKYDFALKRGKPEDVLPLWVADMDFRTPPFVIDALVEKSRHGIFGYSESGQDYFAVLQSWFLQNHTWEVALDWLVKTPGVVYAICTAIRALTHKGDSVLIQQPVYYPFAGSVLLNERKLVVNQLIYAENRYTINFEDFENKIIENKVKLFILCSPHNPVGRVWTEEELTRLGDICLKYGVTVVADEIHADFIYPGHKHLVFAKIKPEFAQIAITCTAPSKTFNLAGLQVSNIFIPNPDIRHAFRQEMAKSGYNQLGIMGMVACKAAYQNGRKWLEELINYLGGNLDFLRSFLNEKIPQVKLIEPEGTYLVWLDFNQLNLSEDQLEDLIVKKAGLWLDKGTIFGAGGVGFQRINIACPRSILEKALGQLEKAIKTFKQ
ncbi:Cystathionine beta-lyase PatB [Sporotomaculum syntrophicum]|uniref:cysteine-S-conjugate beta-lyase n=1 Tax=Sporotomaculum syntrophicum TaxID=182264 RepID=A0A9D2WNJ4_9FIRM|nr:MalY/PatB family protein [Sporotomaculum syntrophicum]KAF1084016.1 Cystathionine beta-lyase PatB [Sporotomaculum syntrophicum]